MSGKLPVFNIERFAIHDGQGIRTTVFLQGCRLRCPWCANPESQTIGQKLMFLQKKCVGCGTCAANCPNGAVHIEDGRACIDRNLCRVCGTCAEKCPEGAMQISGRWMDTDEIFRLIVRDRAYYEQTGGGVTFSGGEALLHIRNLLPLLERCREERINVNFETCGAVPEENVKEAIPYAERFLFDIKSMDPVRFASVTGGDLTEVLGNFRLIAAEDPDRLVIRVPVIPGFNHTEEDIRKIFSLALECGVKRVDLLPYHTLGMTKYAQLGREYGFPVRTALKKEEVEPYVTEGKAWGLDVGTGG